MTETATATAGSTVETCHKCGAESMVTDSRPTEHTIRRRRKCKVCGQRWTTQEIRADRHDLGDLFAMNIEIRRLLKSVEQAGLVAELLLEGIEGT